MSPDTPVSARMRWARLRFVIIGPLLSAPPDEGTLASHIAELAEQAWKHPSTGEVVHFSAKSIERWYYMARDQQDPIEALARKVPKHAGTHPTLGEQLVEELRCLRKQHPCWSYQLIYDNLVALARERPELEKVPGYATVRRYMKHHGLGKQPRPRHLRDRGDFVPRERRLFEVAHVHGLWHCDFHETKRKVLCASGEWLQVTLFAMLDDHSRLCCHAQWYVGDGDTESFVHGLERLSIEHNTTLVQTPEQNGKQEVFFSQVEGRLIAMLEGEPALTLGLLNRATQAWVEEEYNRHVHSETKQTPIERWLAGPSVGRPCPDSDALRRAFRKETTRRQRRSDGTVTVQGVRFEVPSAYRTLTSTTLRVARWDLSSVDLVDPRRGTLLAALYPVDRERNAERRRRAIVDATPALAPAQQPAPPGIAPLLRQLLETHAATGLPPAYVPHDLTTIDPEEDPS